MSFLGVFCTKTGYLHKRSNTGLVGPYDCNKRRNFRVTRAKKVYSLLFFTKSRNLSQTSRLKFKRSRKLVLKLAKHLQLPSKMFSAFSPIFTHLHQNLPFFLVFYCFLLIFSPKAAFHGVFLFFRAKTSLLNPI